MRQSAILFFLIGYCAFSFSQELQFSRVFQAVKNNVPVAIINSQPDCFYVLRYNKTAHDFTIEKRAKPSAEIMAFTALRLENINASWFDYEKLDYLFFEHHKQLYFLFEKDVNFKKTIYVKVVDTLSKSSNFMELASLEKEKFVQDYGFTFKRTGDHGVLIIASQTYQNGVTKKTVQFYDPEQQKMTWTKKLPLENNYSGHSSAFECNASGDLFYVLIKSRVAGYTRKYIGTTQMNVPVFFHDTVSLLSYPATGQPLLARTTVLTNIGNLNSVRILPGEDQLIFQANIGNWRNDSAGMDLFFSSQKFSTDLQRQYYAVTTPLADPLKNALTFYDGSDFKSAGQKEYVPLKQFTDGNTDYQVSERRDDYFYKELLVWQTDLQTGSITYQGIVPRKVLSFKNRTRYKKIGEAMFASVAGKLNLIVLESAANFKSPPSEFKYHQFKKETNLWRANVMMYTIKGGSLEKKLVYHNSAFDMVPLTYSASEQTDLVFYLSSGKEEKFAILTLNPL